MTDNARETGASLEAMYRFLLWLVPTLEGFPRSQRFLLGDRMQTAAGHAEAGPAAIDLCLVTPLSDVESSLGYSFLACTSLVNASR